MGHIPIIHALNSDTHTLRIQKQFVGVAVEDIDISYMGLIICNQTLWAIQYGSCNMNHVIWPILYEPYLSSELHNFRYRGMCI